MTPLIRFFAKGDSKEFIAERRQRLCGTHGRATQDLEQPYPPFRAWSNPKRHGESLDHHTPFSLPTLFCAALIPQ